MNMIYDHDDPLDTQDRARQIRHLAVLGIASGDSIWKVRQLKDAYRSLFEVIARLADEIEDDLDRQAELKRKGGAA